MKYRYRFKIWRQNKNLKEISDFFNSLDLGISDFAIEEEYEIVFNKLHEIEAIKELITKAYEAYDNKIFKIEGGRIE